MADELKDCPEEFMKCGAAMVLLRHDSQKLERRFKTAFEMLEATEPIFKAAGAPGFLYGPTFAHLGQARCAPGWIMMAHENMSAHCIAAGFRTPTNEELVKYGVPLNWR